MAELITFVRHVLLLAGYGFVCEYSFVSFEMGIFFNFLKQGFNTRSLAKNRPLQGCLRLGQKEVLLGALNNGPKKEESATKMSILMEKLRLLIKNKFLS
jgi:hypothetical protein